MKFNTLRKKYIEFFKKNGHAEIQAGSLIPENDPSVLFTTAGMHPLVPYLLGEKHPAGKRLVDCQKCVRTGDIDEVGDDLHLTLFEMLGNWSMGDYFKKESIKFSYKFLIEELKLPVERLAVTVFEGDKDVPRDEESARAWEEAGLNKNKIYFCSRKHNWWGPAGETGPCGPDSEIFYDTLKEPCSKNCGPDCDCGKYVEIWNNVFMEYNKLDENTYVPLEQKNIDTGLGFERVLAIVNNKKNIFETELFESAIKKIEEFSGQKQTEENKIQFRVIADHIRAATFILGDESGVVPSNSEQGYILRRLIRRTSRYLKKLGIADGYMKEIAKEYITIMGEAYPELIENKDIICNELDKEEKLFAKTIEYGIKMFDKWILAKDVKKLSGELAFKLYDTYGFPLEFTIELCKENEIEIDIDGFNKQFVKHQEKSRAGAEQKFKGGLADNSEQTTKLHSATHLLQKALRLVLDDDTISQRGSNITPERLRFDFSFGRKVTAEELKKVEDMVNEVIATGANVTCEELTLEEAKNSGAIGLFLSKYGNKVKVYTIGDFSKEMCGGPHVENTTGMGTFKILKETSASAGVRRIKATLVN